jgi:aspartate aminotransferase
MSTYDPSANVAELRESATIAVSARAKALKAAGRAVIDLGAGEPDFPTPAHVTAAAHAALAAGATRYTQVEGIAPLRERIAARASQARGEAIGADQVVVTAGTKQALFNACFSLFGTGDEVLVPTPGWTSYYEMLALADERGWGVISDEIYRAIAYEFDAPSLLEIAPSMNRLVVVDGVAKSFAMTGWRIGWSVAPRALTRSMTALQSHTTSNAATLSQHAALAALADDVAARRAIDAMVAEFRARRDAALALLDDARVDVIRPCGAFYLYMRVRTHATGDPEPGTTFARRLLEEHDVAVVPGVAFRSPEWIRLSYAAPRDQVLEGVRRVIAAGI